MTYFGTEIQVALQRRAEELYDWLYTTAGCCHPGKFCGTDDQNLLGWQAIEEVFAETRYSAFDCAQLRSARRSPIDLRLWISTTHLERVSR